MAYLQIDHRETCLQRTLTQAKLHTYILDSPRFRVSSDLGANTIDLAASRVSDRSKYPAMTFSLQCVSLRQNAEDILSERDYRPYR